MEAVEWFEAGWHEEFEKRYPNVFEPPTDWGEVSKRLVSEIEKRKRIIDQMERSTEGNRWTEKELKHGKD